MIVPPSIKTERLVIRRHVPEDFEPMCSFFSDEEATSLLDMTAEQKTEAAVRTLLDAVIASYDSEEAIFAMAIVEMEGGRFVGSCGMAPDDLEPEEIQIFYVILPEFQGRGFASEAATALAERAFTKLGVERLFASMAAENAASVKVAEKLGMIFEGSTEKELNGVAHQGHRYSLAKSRFFEVRRKGAD
ncbi:GNAT family N-acetyltransferase [Methanocrinis sp.]|uniref:GNAT family N-acetyltransferase n=1 Tax=Methanocrinis sp. TaxID=3101522 RepID=UPI003D0CA078